ncbi:MAG: hypothetical protein P8179_04640 [Candidatus Thiodiazotropha sp.]
MKITYQLLLSLLFFVISGCNQDDDSEKSPLLGVWVTDACEQAFDESDEPVNTWMKGLYTFTNYGTIQKRFKTYSDSNCTTLSTPSSLEEAEIPITYFDQGKKLLKEGINGGGLLIEMGAGEEFLSIDAFYTIKNGTLCFSDAFTFEALQFGITETGTDDIDFENCLVRP